MTTTMMTKMAKMSTTAMPFLYQTRTICRITRFPKRTLPLSLATSAGFHSSTCRAAWQPRKDAWPGRGRGGEAPEPGGRQDVPEQIPFELPPDVQLPLEEVGVRKPPVDTITPTERRAFKNIFMEIADRGEEPVKMKNDKLEIQDDHKRPGVSRFLASLVANQQGTKDGRDNSIGLIMQNAAESLQQAPPAAIPGLDSLSPLETMYSAADREQALLNFPPSLRQAARVAYGVVGGDTSTTVREEGGKRARMATALPERDSDYRDPVDAVGLGEHSDLVHKLKIDADRRSERLRIRGLMQAAKTDAQLWDIMESEVFTLVKRLGLESEVQLKATRGKRGKKPKASEPSSPLNPETYGPIYPMLLFEGVHLLNTKFPRPSPYIFHVLPRVKDLGLMSYVLGVSTSFYNQLMNILWERYGDAVGALNTMEEMRHAGLFFDQQSQKIVRSITAVYQDAQSGKQGTFARKLMGMPEYEPLLLQRLHHWEKQIYSSIAHQMQAMR